MEIVIIYRISDHSNPEKIKPGYGSKENCLKTLVREFGNKNLHIICDNVTKQTHEMVQKYSSNIELTNNGNTGAFLYSWNKAKELTKDMPEDTIVYLVEDDYIHKTESLAEMVFAYEKFSSIFERELFMLSTDYPYLYKKMENSKILVGEKYHWRTVKESLLTFLTSSQMLYKYEKKLFDMAKNESNPFEKNLHEIFDKELCFSPLPSLSIHCSNVNSIFGLSCLIFVNLDFAS